MILSIKIDCRFNFDVYWPVLGHVYTCEVMSMDFSDNSTFITGFNGTHVSGYSNDDVRMIEFDLRLCPRFNLTIVPKGFLNFFPNFTGLAFYNCSIDFLNGNELDEYPNLEYWFSQNTELTRVPGEFFVSTLGLRFVNFGNNKIQRIGEGLLDHLNDLDRAFFYNNDCISHSAANPTQIPALIRALKEKCPDIDDETTTETTTEISTTSEPRCEIDDIEIFVCNLEEEIEMLKIENENMQSQIRNLNEENLYLKDIVEDLRRRVENLETVEE